MTVSSDNSLSWNRATNGAPPTFIAEVSSNHGQDLARSLAFVQAAADVGCDAIKFQLFRLDELFAPEILDASEEHRKRRAWELPFDHIPAIAEACEQAGLDFGCTPFYLAAVPELAPYVSFFKIASYELLWDQLIAACAATGRPLILSTGLATLDEIQHGIQVAKNAGALLPAVLHCNSSYPTPVDECNLKAIETLAEATHCPVGWSDHSRSPAVLYRAVHRYGARILEFHLDLDADGAEYAAGHCWLPHEIAPVIAHIRAGFQADGTGEKVPSKSEFSDREWRRDPVDGLRPLKHVRQRYAS